MAWHIVIAGGGFGGLQAARTLERILPPHSARITLVNDVNFMLYTPLLPGAAAGHARAAPRRGPAARAAAPHRPAPRRRSAAPSPTATRCTSAPTRATTRSCATTSSIVALGSVVADAAGPRAWPSTASASRRCPRRSPCATACCGCLEAAETLDDPAEREAWLTFVFVGAGLRRAGGRGRAPGLRRRRARPLPALPHAGRALRPRRGARPRDARDPASRSRTSPRASCAAAGWRSGRRRRSRRSRRRLGAALGRRAGPDADGRLDRGRQAPPGRGPARAAARRRRAHRGRQLPAGPGASDDVWAIGDAAAVPDPAKHGRAADAAHRPARDSPGPRGSRATSPARSAGAAGRPFRYRTLGVFVDMGRREAVAPARPGITLARDGRRGGWRAPTTWR